MFNPNMEQNMFMLPQIPRTPLPPQGFGLASLSTFGIPKSSSTQGVLPLTSNPVFGLPRLPMSGFSFPNLPPPRFDIPRPQPEPAKPVYDFYKNYDANLQKIMTVKDLTSNSHRVVPELANQWVDAQANQQRRDAAKSLIDNTHYITFNNVFEAVRTLVIRIYNDLEDKNQVCLFAFAPDRSNYFMSVIAVYYIRLLGYPDPQIIYDVRFQSLELARNKSLLVIDDMAYTGIQISNIYNSFNNIDEYGSILRDHNIKLYIGLVAIAEQALTLLTKLDLKLYYEIYIPSMMRVMSKRRFLELSYYFSPYSEGRTQVSVYFDHKVADELSTFVKVLMSGPVLPSDLEFEPLIKHDIYTLLNGLVEHKIWHPNTINPSEEERKREDESIDLYDAEFESYTPLLNSMIQDDRVCDRDVPKLDFIPFIEGCSLPANVEALKAVSYLTFMTGRDLDVNGYTIDDNPVVEEFMKPENRCINSFYKAGPYAMV